MKTRHDEFEFGRGMAYNRPSTSHVTKTTCKQSTNQIFGGLGKKSGFDTGFRGRRFAQQLLLLVSAGENQSEFSVAILGFL